MAANTSFEISTIISTCVETATRFNKEPSKQETKTQASILANQLDITNLEQRLHVLSKRTIFVNKDISDIKTCWTKRTTEAILRQHVSLAMREHTEQLSNLVSLRLKSATFIVELVNGDEAAV